MNPQRVSVVLLALASAAAAAIIPDWPHRHLDEPTYWGVVGYGVVFIALVARPAANGSDEASNRRILRLFLVGLPLVYVASAFRLGASTSALSVQLAGLMVWLVLALAAKRSDGALWAGCAGHAVWDGLHFGRTDFVPDWYIAACAAVDVGLGAFVLLRLHEERDS